MLKKIISIFIILGISGCIEQKKENQVQLQKDKNPNTDSVQVRFFPKNKISSQRDTLIQTLGLKISISEKSLDTYVIDSFESESERVKYIDKYRDIEYSLVIKEENLKTIDTSLNKESFKDFAGEELIKYGNFTTYEFDKTEENKLIFLGVIQEPETDWSYFFYHIYDLEKNEFKIKEITQN